MSTFSFLYTKNGVAHQVSYFRGMDADFGYGAAKGESSDGLKLGLRVTVKSWPTTGYSHNAIKLKFFPPSQRGLKVENLRNPAGYGDFAP